MTLGFKDEAEDYPVLYRWPLHNLQIHVIIADQYGNLVTK